MALPAPDAPGRYLALVLRVAQVTAPGWWTPVELTLMERLPGLTLADAIARMAQRTQPEATPEEVAGWLDTPSLQEAMDAGWLELLAPPQGTPVQWDVPTLPVVRLSVAAAVIVPAALAVATGGERDAWTTLIRTGMGQLEVPEGSPLATVLAGARPVLSPLPWASRRDLEDWLEARSARDAGPDQADVPALLARLEAAAGARWRFLGHHLTALHSWTRLGWEVVGQLPQAHPMRRRLLRALRRCPLEPSLACQVATELWRISRLRPLGRRLARDYATWSIWTEGERKRWQRRAEARPHLARDQTWPVRTLSAWLDHTPSGAVLADGLRVEARVLAAVRAEGWDGLHAEGWFWQVLAHRLAAPLFAAPVPGVWVAHLQRQAIDTGRWGWLQRRMVLMGRLTQCLMRDPVGSVEAVLREDDDPRLSAPARAVAAGMETVVLLELLKRILADPDAAAGLPDLVAWKGSQVALWEVKSPGDQVRDGQRDWLAWGRSHGLVVGVWEIQAKLPGGRPGDAVRSPMSATTMPPRRGFRSPDQGHRTLGTSAP